MGKTRSKKEGGPSQDSNFTNFTVRTGHRLNLEKDGVSTSNTQLNEKNGLWGGGGEGETLRRNSKIGLGRGENCGMTSGVI